jgi:uncharacterized protein (TIRG00374 family)
LTQDAAESPPSGKRWKSWIPRVLGLALLAYVVVFQVHWRDSVVVSAPPPNGTRLVGEIVGEIPQQWTAESAVVFRGVDGVERTLHASDLLVDKGTSAPDVDEGLVRIVRRSDKGLLVLGFLIYGLITQFGVLRWWLLLRAQDIRIPYRLAHRLTFIGFFFNNVVPGPTGGDVVKAVYAVKTADAHKRAQAIVTVVIDRVVGLLSLALIAASVLVFKLDDEKYGALAAFIGLVLAGFVVASVLFFSRRVRKAIRFESWSAKLPGGAMIRKADEAVFLWRNHKKDVLVALLLSFGNQLSIQGMMILFATALHVTTLTGDPVSWTTYMSVLPVGFIVSALPVLPGGWGIREAAFAYCFGLVGVGRNPAIALSVLNGMTQLFWGLLGGVYFVQGRRDAPPPAELTQAAR